jgi:hypothetical protein
LAGTNLGCNADTLRTTSLALVFSAAEYCAPVWLNSAHTHKVDVQLNNAMRLITGTVKSTELQWLPVLSNIPPPRHEEQLDLEEITLIRTTAECSKYPTSLTKTYLD